jgi:cytochrome P450
MRLCGASETDYPGFLGRLVGGTISLRGIMLRSESESRKEALDRIRSTALAELQADDVKAFAAGAELEIFRRLRAEDPVHYQPEHEFGPYWSVTRWHDIFAVNTDHEAFSSERSISIIDHDSDFTMPMFIAMDPPKHDVQRKTVQPMFSGANLMALERLIRERAGTILDELPIGLTIDWVDKVSIELTAMTLATLFDIPQEDRRKLTRWSDVVVARPNSPLFASPETAKEERKRELKECLDYFLNVWNERVNAEPKGDFVSLMAHGASTRNMAPMEYLGNLLLLIFGGNDTTRNTITGSVVALNQNPDQYAELKADPGLIPNMVSETIRWQTPLAHMRRNATRDIELGGKTIRKGDKVVMWHVSGNRDESQFERADAYWIERPNARQHLSFGYGIHRCMGSRLAELQLKIVWEEILKRFSHIEAAGEPKRVWSTFVRGYDSLPVVLHR